MENETMTETELRKLRRDLAGACKLLAIQQTALERLGAVVDAHQRLFEAQAGYKPPTPAESLNN